MFKPFQLTQINYDNDKKNAVYGLNTINQKKEENEFKANYDTIMKGGNNNKQRSIIKSKKNPGDNFLPPEAKKTHFRHSAEKTHKSKNILQGGNKSKNKNYNKNNMRSQDMTNYGNYNMTINNSRLYSNKNNGNNFNGYNNSKTTKNKCSSLDKKGINNYYNKFVNSGFSKTALNANAKNNRLNYNQNFFNE